MKIVIDARRLRNFGIGTYIRNLVDALAEIDSENDYTLVRLPADAGEFLGLPANFHVAEYDREDTAPSDHFLFPAYLHRFRADLVHFPINRVPLLMPRPYVVTMHDLSALLYEERRGLRQNLRYFRFKHGLTRASAIIVVSASTGRDVQHLLGIDRARLRVVHNAPDPDFFKHPKEAEGGVDAWLTDREHVLERYQVNYPFLLYAGSIRPQKNVPRLVEAFAVAREEFEHMPEWRDLRLIIIGDDISRYPQVRRAVIESRVENSVRFLGHVPFDTLRVFYESATAFVFPSLYEGFGLPPIEAMASGTPVITSANSSLPEVVGNAAMLVNPENVFDIARGIKEVLFDPALRKRLSEAGRAHAATFSWRRTAQEVLQIYREVAGK